MYEIATGPWEFAQQTREHCPRRHTEERSTARRKHTETSQRPSAGQQTVIERVQARRRLPQADLLHRASQVLPLTGGRQARCPPAQGRPLYDALYCGDLPAACGLSHQGAVLLSTPGCISQQGSVGTRQEAQDMPPGSIPVEHVSTSISRPPGGPAHTAADTVPVPAAQLIWCEAHTDTRTTPSAVPMGHASVPPPRGCAETTRRPQSTLPHLGTQRTCRPLPHPAPPSVTSSSSKSAPGWEAFRAATVTA